MKENLKILIVDDEEDIRNLLVDLLEPQASSIDTAKDGHEALSLIEKNQYDLILLDNQMPQKTGEELLLDISKMLSKDFKIIFITGGNKSLLQLIEDNNSYHVVDYVLNKPFNAKHLNDIISDLVIPVR